jgi:plastocyanin
MGRNSVSVFLLIIAITAAASAGTVSGKVSGVSGKSVVYLDAPGKTFPPPAGQHPVMDQKGLLFQPHIMVVQQGAMVDFLNSDNVQHNVYWPSVGGDKKATHNMGTWPKGEKRSFKFDKPGTVPLLCNVHPEMAGYIIVSPSPYYAETDDSGNYTIANVPDGSYTASAWHEGAKTQNRPVTVSGDSGKADFTLSKQ